MITVSIPLFLIIIIIAAFVMWVLVVCKALREIEELKDQVARKDVIMIVELAEKLKSMNLNANSILVIKNELNLDTDTLRHAFQQHYDLSIMALFVDDLDDIRHIDEQDMARLGWIRKENDD